MDLSTFLQIIYIIFILNLVTKPMKMLSTCVIFAESKYELWILVDIMQYYYTFCCIINVTL